MYVRVHFWATSSQANSLLRETTAIHGGTDTSSINLCAATKGIPAIRGGAAEPALLKIGDVDARSVQKTPAGVLAVRRGLFFVKRQRRCPSIFKRRSGVLILSKLR